MMRKTDEVIITLTDGRIYKLNDRSTLSDIDKDKEALFVFDNGNIFNGYTDGEVDSNEEFIIFSNIGGIGFGLPVHRLVGWAYEKSFD